MSRSASSPHGGGRSRRWLLQATAATLVAGSGGCEAPPTTGPWLPIPSLSHVPPRRWPTLWRLAETVLPPGTTAAELRRVALGVDARLDGLSQDVVEGLLLALDLLESRWSRLLLPGPWRPFTELAATERAEAFAGWRTAPLTELRAAYHARRKLLLAVHYAHLEVAARIGYPGPPFEKLDPGPILPREPLDPKGPLRIMAK